MPAAQGLHQEQRGWKAWGTAAPACGDACFLSAVAKSPVIFVQQGQLLPSHSQLLGGRSCCSPCPGHMHPLLERIDKVWLFIHRGVASVASSVSLWNRQRRNPAENAQGQR